ncbi:MAG: DUF4339 domain-containing protein [Sandaracinaceae bacterium]|nr:DUF4339 domain-containing protein [Sandaracinaceae bacterium]
MTQVDAEALFVHDGSEKRGPLTVERFEHLREQGEIDESCSYWYDGMAQWRPVTCFVPPCDQPSSQR